LVALLGDNVVKANFFQFDNDFVGLGVEDEMLQDTFKSVGYSVSAQDWKRAFTSAATM